jgi:hypothetical protein
MSINGFVGVEKLCLPDTEKWVRLVELNVAFGTELVALQVLHQTGSADCNRKKNYVLFYVE